MSLLIKGMDMPKCCDDCSIRSFSLDGMICPLIDENVTNQEFAYKRHQNCPLVEVPAPHGDLIDRNMVLCLGNVLLNDTVIHKWAVIKAPAIIKQEE